MTDGLPRGETQAERNPFSTRFTRPGALPFQFTGEDLALVGDSTDPLGALVDRLEHNGWRGQIVGPHGSGKSTLLAGLIPRFERRGKRVRLVVLRDGQRRLPAGQLDAHTLGREDLVVIDGYEQLGWPARTYLRWRVAWRSAGLLITTHTAVALPKLLETHPTLALARQLVARLTEHSRPVSPAVIEELYQRSHGDLRELFFQLYDWYESNRS